MNFRTVAIIRHGLRRGESGQAFAELSVSLIAILAAFIGFLLVAALSSDRVSTLIRAREKVDAKFGNNFVAVYSSGEDVESIRNWNKGADGIPFTADDEKILGSPGDSTVFADQLSDNTGRLMLQNPPSSLPQLKSDFSSLSSSNFFVNAACLISDTESSDPFYEHKLDSLQNSIQWLFGIRNVRIEERVFMPAHKD